MTLIIHSVPIVIMITSTATKNKQTLRPAANRLACGRALLCKSYVPDHGGAFKVGDSVMDQRIDHEDTINTGGFIYG